MPLFRLCALLLLIAAQPLGAWAQAPRAHEMEGAGRYAGSCSGWAEEREALAVAYEAALKLDLMFNEPVIRSSLRWRPEAFGGACIRPYGSSEMVQIANPAALDPQQSARPYNVELVAELASSAMGQRPVYLRFNPGALSETPGQESYNTPGARDWGKLFFTLSSALPDPRDTENYGFLDADTAKEVFAGDLGLIALHVVQADFDLTALKSAYGAAQRQQVAMAVVAGRLVDWGESAIADYPSDLRARIRAKEALPPAESVAAQTALIAEIEALHAAAKAGLPEAAQAALGQVSAGVSAFSDQMEEFAPGSPLFDALTVEVAQAAQQERREIEAKVAELALLRQPLPGAASEVFAFARVPLDISASHYLLVCARTAVGPVELEAYDVTPSRFMVSNLLNVPDGIGAEADREIYSLLKDRSKHGNSVAQSPILARFEQAIVATDAFASAKPSKLSQGISYAWGDPDSGEKYWKVDGELVLLSEEVHYETLEQALCQANAAEDRALGFKTDTLDLGAF